MPLVEFGSWAVEETPVPTTTASATVDMFVAAGAPGAHSVLGYHLVD